MTALVTWVVRLGWASLPLTLGAQLADAAAGHSDPVGISIVVMAWIVWGIVLAASLITLPAALVVLRCGAPTAVIAAIFADVDHSPTPLGWIGLVTAVLVAAAAMSGDLGDLFVNGASYGDERRFALRVPAALLLGPIPAMWVLTVVPLPAGILLIAAGQLVVGILVSVLGAASAWWAARSLARLADRWCVFVPAGVTLVDHLALAEPTLIPAGGISRMGPAAVGSDALDLSVGATGLICEISLVATGQFVPAGRPAEVSEAVDADAVLFAVTRPGAMLRAASERGIPTG